MKRQIMLPLCWLALLCSTAFAQADRFELGQRLRACEAAGTAAVRSALFAYDARDNLINQLTGFNLTAPKLARTTFAYDPFGNVTGTTEAVGQPESRTAT